jgi:hypothetical protein
MDFEIGAKWVEMIRGLFPKLNETNYRVTSQIDYNYNCFSWAMGCNDVIFDGHTKGCRWPWINIPDDNRVDTWVRIFGTMGYVDAGGDASFVAGWEKVAFFEDSTGATHAARQNESGWWMSKLGDIGPDIDHAELSALESGYGRVARVVQRKRAP